MDIVKSSLKETFIITGIKSLITTPIGKKVDVEQAVDNYNDAVEEWKDNGTPMPKFSSFYPQRKKEIYMYICYLYGYKDL